MRSSKYPQKTEEFRELPLSNCSIPGLLVELYYGLVFSAELPGECSASYRHCRTDRAIIPNPDQ